MNEEQKNIETCLAEDVLSEVANVPTDPQFVSLTDEAFDPLKQQALQQAGYDGYDKVASTHQPYTFTSSVKQMKSNLILLLRRLWRFPFGRGNTASSDAGSASASAAGSSSASSSAGSASASAAAPIRSLADMWQHYITRLKGNPEYGIPSRLSSLTDLPDAPALLADRKICGVIGVPDGMSLAQLLHASAVYNTITELKDDTSGWTLGRTFQKSLFPNLTKLALGCKTANIPIVQDMPDLEHLDLPNLEGEFNIIISGENKVKELYLPNVGTCTVDINNGWAPITSTEIEELIIGITNLKSTYHHAIIRFCSTIKRLIAPRFVRGYFQSFFYDCPNLEYIYVPKSKTIANIGYDGNQLSNLAHLKTFIAGGLLHDQYVNNSWMSFDGCPQLIHLEVEGSITDSTNIQGWSPTTALMSDTTAEGYVDLREDMTLANNLQQFLSNFKTYIAERLTDNGTGLTLTLSQEVRNAIHAAEDEYGIENIIITKKGWTISPAPN